MKRIALVLLLFASALFADAARQEGGYALFDTTANVIQFPQGDAAFEKLYEKLDSLVFLKQGKLRILHLGGSHIQADVMSGRFRERLAMSYPAMAADRGFVFPYSAARTNTPSSYSSVYKGKWDMSKNVLREVTKPLGLLGIAVSTEDPRAEFTIAINRYSPEPIWFFDRARLFGFADSANVEPVLILDSAMIHGTLDTANGSYVFELPRPSDTLQIAMLWSDTLLQDSLAQAIEDSIALDSLMRDSLKQDSIIAAALPGDSLFRDSVPQDTLLADSLLDTIPRPARPRFTLSGVLLENSSAGISYTSVGINGARVPHYFEEPCPNLERDLAFYKPDLVILSIGINDANVENFDEKRFRANYDTLITRLYRVAPNVPIIFTSNNDSYKKIRRRRYAKHPNGAIARDAFKKLAEDYKAGFWDLFTLMGGLGSMSDWEKAGLAKKDKVHFTHDGYVFLGDMLYAAFLKAYDNHLTTLIAKEPEPVEPLVKSEQIGSVPPSSAAGAKALGKSSASAKSSSSTAKASSSSAAKASSSSVSKESSPAAQSSSSSKAVSSSSAAKPSSSSTAKASSSAAKQNPAPVEKSSSSTAKASSSSAAKASSSSAKQEASSSAAKASSSSAKAEANPSKAESAKAGSSASAGEAKPETGAAQKTDTATPKSDASSPAPAAPKAE